MRIIAFAFSIIILLAFGFCYEEPPPPLPQGDLKLSLQLFDESGNPVNSTKAFLSVADASGSKSFQLSYFLQSNSFTAYLPEGNWNCELIADDTSTPAIDYAYSFSVELAKDSELSLQLYEVGGAYIMPKDEQGNILADAKLGVNCPRIPITALPSLGQLIKPNSTGMFIGLPSGTCIAEARSGNLFGKSTIIVSRGMITEHAIELKEKTTVQPSNQATWDPQFLVLALVILFFVLVFMFLRKNKNQPETIPEKKPESGKNSEVQPKPKPEAAGHTKLQSVLKTLPEREAKIVNLLNSEGGQLKQSKIMHKLLIPRASLSRTLKTLENKNIVSLERFGRTKAVTLNSWLFEKD